MSEISHSQKKGDTPLCIAPVFNKTHSNVRIGSYDAAGTAFKFLNSIFLRLK